MKEIKFRAFSKISKKFVDWDDMAIGPATPKENYKDGMVYIAFPPDGMLQECNEHHFTFQLWTGLKDKNGKEIYEGDIIKVGNELIKVEWLDWCAGFCPFNELNDDYGRSGINPKPENCEVIANIFENPESISQKNQTQKKPELPPNRYYEEGKQYNLEVPIKGTIKFYL